MTTAHRPTWKPAVGRSSTWSAGGAVSTQTSARDAPAHMSLKYRSSDDSDKQAALKESLKALADAEEASSVTTGLLLKRSFDPEEEERVTRRLLKSSADVDESEIKKKYDDSDVDDGGGSSSESESDLDADDDDPDGHNNNSDSDLDDSSDEDEEAALQAELEKIRAERQEAKRKSEAEAAQAEHEIEEEAALLGNPLLNADMKKKKRGWNDDIVFRNQAKDEPVPKKRFINDTVRSDFHRRFLKKFIR